VWAPKKNIVFVAWMKTFTPVYTTRVSPPPLVAMSRSTTSRNEAALRRTSSLASHLLAAAAPAVDPATFLRRSPTSSSPSSFSTLSCSPPSDATRSDGESGGTVPDTSGVGTPDAWIALVGAQLGPGSWIAVDQARVDAFAECTLDHQWIHKAGSETIFGGPIAHGLLSLSLLPALMHGRDRRTVRDPCHRDKAVSSQLDILSLVCLLSLLAPTALRSPRRWAQGWARCYHTDLSPRCLADG